MKKFIKVILIVLLIIALLLAGVLYLLIGTTEQIKTDITQYKEDLQEIGNAAVYMPDLELLGNYTGIDYRYKTKCYSPLLGFFSDAFALFVTYNDSQYNIYKNRALSDYTFLQQPIKRSADTYELPITEFSYKGYEIKIVPDKEYIDFCACKSFMMIGCNDEASTIVYMYYYDFDIDYIAQEGEDFEEEMCELINEAFSWSH